MPLFIYVDFLYHRAPEGALFFRFKAIVDTAEVLGKNGFHSLEVRALFLGGRSYELRELGLVQLVVPAVFFQVNYFVQLQFFQAGQLSAGRCPIYGSAGLLTLGLLDIPFKALLCQLAAKKRE